jgi:hypothetical protein
MCLLIVLSWGWAMVRHGGGRILFSRHSRFGEFNSRLGQCEFPVRPATGIRWQQLDLACSFGGQRWVLSGKSAKFPVQREKPGMLSRRRWR